MSHSYSQSTAPSTFGDCVASLRTSLTLLESSVDTLGTGVSDYPRLANVLKTVRVRTSIPFPASRIQSNITCNTQHYELLPQPTLSAAEASLRDEIGPFVAYLLDRADRQTERQARRIETLKARSDLNAGRLSRGPSPDSQQQQQQRPQRQPVRAGSSSRKTLDGGAGLRARAVRARREALQYSVERLEMEVATKERELRMRLQEA